MVNEHHAPNTPNVLSGYVRLKEVSLPHEVQHAGFVEQGLELGNKRCVLRMRQIDFQTGLVFKGDKETMREAVIEALRAHIGAPFEGSHGIDLLGEFDEGVFDALHLSGCGAVFEFEEHNVAVGGVCGGGEGGHGGEEKGESE